MRVVCDDGVTLWVERSGRGVPLVACHGGPGLWSSLGRFTSLVDDVATVYRWDQRGCGRSDRVGPYTVSRMVDDLEVLRAAAGVDRWVVLGHSWGALLALHYAVTHPDRTMAAVYVSGQGLLDSWYARNRAVYRDERSRRMTAGQQARLDELEATSRTATEEREYRLLAWFTDVSPGAPAATLLAEDLDAPWEINTEANRSLMADAALEAAALRSDLSTLDRPVLVVHGANDPRPLAGPRELVGILPHAELAVLPTGHSPWLEAPRETGAVVRTWLERRTPGPDR